MNLKGWGLYPNHSSNPTPLDPQTLSCYLQDTPAFIPHGNGRSYGDSALNDHILHTTNHNHFLSFDPVLGILKAQCGVLLSEILKVVVPKGWFLQVTPGTKLITLGGAIASDVHGKNHHIAGCFSQSIIDFTLMTPDGTTHLVTPNTDLFRLTCGGMGLTGIILEAAIKLKPIKSQFINQTTIKTKNLQDTFRAFEQYAQSPYSVAWIDCLSQGDKLGRCLLMVGDFAKDGDLNYAPKDKFTIPFTFPTIALNTLSVKAFNALYYAKAPKGTSRQIVDIDTFFYPLDAIGKWNRIYGKNGFTQYQFILPKDTSYEGLEEILQTIATSGKGSFLAVLKLYGKANDNYLSFPLEGYSLALDFKIERGLFELLDALDAIVLKHQGRIYLAKDCRMNAQTFWQSYPYAQKLKDFRKDTPLHSLQSKRIKL